MEIADNVVDMAHFFYIHYALPTYFKNVFEGQTATQYHRRAGRTTTPPAVRRHPARVRRRVLRARAMINPALSSTATSESEVILINCHYPVDQNSCAHVRPDGQEARRVR